MKEKNSEPSHYDPTRLRASVISGAVAVLVAFLLAGSYSAKAFTFSDQNIAMDSFNTAYYQPFGSGLAHYMNSAGGGGGVVYFWSQAEEIEVLIDAYERGGGNVAYQGMISSLLNGFSSDNGTDWSWDMYNDDVCWACIAYLRGYQDTGNSTFLNIAKANFDMMYARAWDTTFGGGLWWTTAKGGKNACVNGPAAIVASLLYRALNDSSYLTKAQNIYNWEKATLFVASTGAICDNITTSGLGTWASTYNQGTFIGAADYLGDTASATLAMNFTENVLSAPNGSGYNILPEYGIGGNNSGFNSIGIRWMAKFMRDQCLQGTYLGWLQANNKFNRAD
jgi:predicted alpha-1,6-mannanase (GH76 family)